MNPRVAYFLAFILSLLALTIAAPDGTDDFKPKPKPSPTPKPKPKPPTCNKELLCCLDATSPTSPSAKSLIRLLHVNLTPEQKTQEVGLTCSALQKGSFSEACTFKTLCCDKDFESGFIAIGCTEASG